MNSKKTKLNQKVPKNVSDKNCIRKEKKCCNNSNFNTNLLQEKNSNEIEQKDNYQIIRDFVTNPNLSKENSAVLVFKKSEAKSQSALKDKEKNVYQKPPALISTSKSSRKKSYSNSLCDNLQAASKHSENLNIIDLKGNNHFNKITTHFISIINQAIKLQKVFSIGNQNRTAFPTIRDSLKARGWVEKCYAQTLIEDGTMLPTKVADATKHRLNECDVNFIWVTNNVDFGSIKDDTIVSRFPKNNHFTTKVGLCSFLDDFHWFYQPGVSKTIAPRTFRIANTDDIGHFFKEFGLTACVSLLKIIVHEVSTAESNCFFRGGKVPITVVDFANAQCSEYITFRRHDDIDRQEDVETTTREWTEFLSWFYKIAHEKEHFESTNYPMIQALYSMSKMTLKNIEPYWPQLEYEGSQNLWVVKPAAQFCGRGIRVFERIEDIISHIHVNDDNKISHHIVQKYIEKPLLIFNTKFDIRQWFLVTSIYPLVIWIYKECYLRFSSQLFSLEDLHESIHLTNNAIQKNYANNPNRHPKLPKENMWHNSTFQDYLRDIGELDKWKDIILPGMKQGIVGALLASQDEMIDRPNSFELYGADFLLTEDFTPILLEINKGPAMAPSTTITSDLCKRGLEDVLKVVLDRKHDAHADVGQFEILFKQEMGQRPQHLGMDLVVYGNKVTPEKRTKKNV